MKILIWCLTLTFIIVVLIQAVSFHRSTICRQKTWLKATENFSRTLLFSSTVQEQNFIPECETVIMRTGKKIIWSKAHLRPHSFELSLEGRL